MGGMLARLPRCWAVRLAFWSSCDLHPPTARRAARFVGSGVVSALVDAPCPRVHRVRAATTRWGASNPWLPTVTVAQRSEASLQRSMKDLQHTLVSLCTRWLARCTVPPGAARCPIPHPGGSVRRFLRGA